MVQQLTVQRRAAKDVAPEAVHQAAADGMSTPTTSLPHANKIQALFGPAYDIGSIHAHVGGKAAAACDDMGASAFAAGNHVAFAEPPDLHTAAHEAAHVLQQAQGVNLYGGVGAAGDAYEQHADAVADRVVAGQSAAGLLAASPSGSGALSAVQRDEKPAGTADTKPKAAGGGRAAISDTVLTKEGNELLVLVLRGAASRAAEAQAAIDAEKDRVRARKRFSMAEDDLLKDLDEAVLLSERTPASPAAFRAADSMFKTMIPLLEHASKTRADGVKDVRKRLTALNQSLQKHGYHFPLQDVKEGVVEMPEELERRDLLRAFQLALKAAHAEMRAGLAKLEAERKAGQEPAELYGGQASATHVQEAAVQLQEAVDFHSINLAERWPAIVGEALRSRDLALALIKEGAALPGALPIWRATNALGVIVGLGSITPFGTPTARSRQEAATEHLERMDSKRQGSQESGTAWSQEDSKAQVAAEHEAMDAANKSLGRAGKAAGGHLGVVDVMERVTADIDRIELARSIGFTDAVTFLASQALDTSSNVDSFIKSLVGNVVWALSSFIPAVGLIGKLGSRFANALRIADAARADSLFAATLGTFGAMFGQFSGGMPSSGVGDVSSRLDQLKKGMKEANSQLSDTRRAQAYIAMSQLVSAIPPRPADDRADYLASLETTLRYLLFGEVFERGLNDGPRPKESSVEEEAKRQLLVAATAPFADVTKDGKLKTSTPTLDGDYANKIVKMAGQSGSLTYDVYDLVASRIPIAAKELGCKIPSQFNERDVNAMLATGHPVEIPVVSWSWEDSGVGRSTGRGGVGGPTRWETLYWHKRVWTEPEFLSAFALDSESLLGIDSITIVPSDLKRKTFHGKEIFTLDRVAFSARGGAKFSGPYSGSTSPETFKMIYAFAERG